MLSNNRLAFFGLLVMLIVPVVVTGLAFYSLATTPLSELALTPTTVVVEESILERKLRLAEENEWHADPSFATIAASETEKGAAAIAAMRASGKKAATRVVFSPPTQSETSVAFGPALTGAPTPGRTPAPATTPRPTFTPAFTFTPTHTPQPTRTPIPTPPFHRATASPIPSPTPTSTVIPTSSPTVIPTSTTT
ncbi:MAG: hypothetical protein GXP42_17255, partial [Chloroflexi bacterium]|nr:hypothetical protein [Chloroflexota bacterium]